MPRTRAAPPPAESASSLSGNLVGAGASSQDAAQQAWIAGFQTANPDVTIDYDPSGSGAGRETFLEGASDFAGSDRAFDDEEIAAGGFAKCAPDTDIVELPLYISPIAVIFNVEGVDTLNLDAATIAGIFAGSITNWNDPAIVALNPDATLPDLAITPVHRSDDSGTTENFTDYLGAAAPDVWTYEADGVWPFEGGEAAQGTSGVVDAVTNGTGTIGYADASRAGDLGTVAVQVGDEFVELLARGRCGHRRRLARASRAAPRATSRSRSTAPPTEAGVYPIVLVSYIIGCQRVRRRGERRAREVVLLVHREPRGPGRRGRGRRLALRSRTRSASRSRLRSTRSSSRFVPDPECSSRNAHRGRARPRLHHSTHLNSRITPDEHRIHRRSRRSSDPATGSSPAPPCSRDP